MSADLQDPPLLSSVLYENATKSIVLLDIPRSLEESQVLPGDISTRRILSADPVAEPYSTPEPKDPTARQGGAHHSYAGGASAAAQIEDLMTAASVQSALEELKDNYAGPFHLPRVTGGQDDQAGSRAGNTRLEVNGTSPNTTTTKPEPSHNHIPPNSRYMLGAVQDMSQFWKSVQDGDAKFDLIVADPPWPSRSVRRMTKGYSIASSMKDSRKILSSLPVASITSSDALVGIWVTNKAAVLDYARSEHGLLGAWGLEYVTEWTWLKITAKGEPVCALDSQWRKPWEKLIVAAKKGSTKWKHLKPRIILAVPDLHSRKPHPRCLFQDVVGTDVVALEIFARNMTAGWSSVGDQVDKFQHYEHWTEEE